MPKSDIKKVNYMYRWRKAKKLLREISRPGECKCQWGFNHGFNTHPYGEEACPSCKAQNFLDNLR